jgi:DNA-binding response OmpR family regulator
VTEWAPASTKWVLVVEDSPGECELLGLAWAEQERGNTVQFVQGAESARDLLRQPTAPLPHLILLDLKLRHADGLTLLRQIRADACLSAIPVIIFTSSDDQQDIMASYAAGANGYVVKPGTFADLVSLARDMSRFWLAWNRLPSQEPTPAC